MKKFSWKKGLFSSKYKLYDKEEKIGDFRQKAFSHSSVGSINGTKIKFTKKGFFSSETAITDLSTNEPIGTVKFNTWGNKAEITLDEKTYHWKYDTFWSTRWSISDDQQQLITYKSAFTSGGQIEAYMYNDILLLCGLYVYNYYLAWMIVITVSTAVIASG